MQCSTKKQEIREEMKKLRRQLGKNEVMEKSGAVCGAFLRSDFFLNSRTICVYMSAFNEVDTSAVLKACAFFGKKILLPVTEGDEIYVCRYAGETSEGAFGIREPRKKIREDKHSAEVFIVPALAFDRRGARVGFGKGFYDRLLEGTKAVKIGFLYDFQLVDYINSKEHDINMDYLITESRVIDCASEI